MVMTDLCSDVHIEPLPGTSRVGDTYVLLEHTGAWSHDILDGKTFTAEVSSQLKALDVGLYLIRKPGRAGHVDKPLKTVYLVFGSVGIAETLVVEKAEDICSLDLSGPGKMGRCGLKIRFFLFAPMPSETLAVRSKADLSRHRSVGLSQKLPFGSVAIPKGIVLPHLWF